MRPEYIYKKSFLIQIEPIHLDANCTQRLSANKCGQTQSAQIENRPDTIDLDQALQYGFRSGPTCGLRSGSTIWI